MNFESHSQASQDRFVHALLPKSNGSFLDIGCNDPIVLSNTYALQQIGWKGLLVDNDPLMVERCRELRGPIVIQDDARHIDWKALYHVPITFDYLSLDCDAATLDVLKNIPLDWMKFRIITIEHDAYRFGDEPRKAMREILEMHDYWVICADVMHDGCEFENWYVDSSLHESALRYACARKDGNDIMK